MCHINNTQWPLNKTKCILVSSSALFHCGLLLLCTLFHMLLIALFTGNGESNNQRNKLLKVHLTVSVGVQILHDFVYSSRVLLRLYQGMNKKSYEWCDIEQLCLKASHWDHALHTLCSFHLKEVRQLISHQVPQLSSAERVILAILWGVTVEHRDEGLHGIFQFWRHGCLRCLEGQIKYKQSTYIMYKKVEKDEQLKLFCLLFYFYILTWLFDIWQLQLDE